MTSLPATSAPDRPTTPGVVDLFVGFLLLSVFAFGGVLPWAHYIIVERRRWLDSHEFNEVLSLCQFLPGPNIVNLSIAVGARFAGALGATAAFLGLMAIPFAIVIGLGMLYDRFGELPRLSGMFAGIGAAAAGLIIAMAAKMAAPLLRQRPAYALVFIVLGFVAVGVLRWPLPYVLLGLVPLSTLAAWRLLRQ